MYLESIILIISILILRRNKDIFKPDVKQASGFSIFETKLQQCAVEA